MSTSKQKPTPEPKELTTVDRIKQLREALVKESEGLIGEISKQLTKVVELVREYSEATGKDPIKDPAINSPLSELGLVRKSDVKATTTRQTYKMSVPEAVKTVLDRNGGWMSASDIQLEILDIDSNYPVNSSQVGIQQLTKKNLIEKQGERGSMTFRSKQ